MIVDTTDIEIGDIIDGDRLVADITSSAAYDDQVIVMVDAPPRTRHRHLLRDQRPGRDSPMTRLAVAGVGYADFPGR